MKFRVLGPLEVERGGRVIEVHGSRRRALLALLLLHANEVVRSERLVDELWGVTPPANASAALHNLVWRLRKDLGNELIATKPWGYVLRIEPGAVDLHRFESLIREAKPLPAAERRAKLGEALALWRGPPLAGLEHEPSLSVEIARLADLRIRALEQRVDADLKLGAHEEVIAELEALVAEHPLREHVRGQLILALYRSGRQAEALETYRETRRVFVDELGIDPSPDLRGLERAILRHDPTLVSLPPPEPALREAGPPPRWISPRSPVAIGVALALLAAGGATAGLLLMRGGSVDPVAAAPPAALATPVHAVSLHSFRPPGPRARPQPQVRSTPSRHRAVKTHAKRAHVDRHLPPRTTTAQAPPPAPPPPPPARPPPPPPPPPPPLWLYWLSDNFTDPAVNLGLWDLESSGEGVSAVEQNGRLELSVAAEPVMGAGHSVSEHYATRCLMKGDFDSKVNFSLLTWPAADGVHLELGVWFPPPKEDYVSIGRIGGTGNGPEYYGSGISYTASAPTDDMRGGLRIERTNGVIAVYYRAGRIWRRLASKLAPAPAAPVLMLWTNDVLFGHQGATAAFDNFDAVSDGVTCGGAPVPPRKRRR